VPEPASHGRQHITRESKGSTSSGPVDGDGVRQCPEGNSWHQLRQGPDLHKHATGPRSESSARDVVGLVAWLPDTVTRLVSATAARADVDAAVKSPRHCNATQMLTGGIDRQTAAARLESGEAVTGVPANRRERDRSSRPGTCGVPGRSADSVDDARILRPGGADQPVRLGRRRCKTPRLP
jgi:hypothetical protein